MDYKKSDLIFRICFAVGVFIFIFAEFSQKNWILLISIAILLGGFIQSLVFCRCPSCKKYLEVGLHRKIPKHCPNCGEKLLDDESFLA